MFIRVRNRLLKCPVSIIKNGKQKYTVPAVSKSNEAVEPDYSPILDLSRAGKKRMKKQFWHDKLKKLESVEEKLFGINMPRYYGWKTLHLIEHRVLYDVLSQTQYLTRTHVMENHKLPDFYDSIIAPEKLDTMVDEIKSQIEDNIVFEYNDRVRQNEWKSYCFSDPKLRENVLANSVIRQINRTMLTNFSSKLPHLLEAEVNFEPRVEAFWFVGGMDPPTKVVKAKENLKWLKPYANESVDLQIQYRGSPTLHLRHQFPLKEIMSLSESENSALNVPQVKIDPRGYGYHFSRQHATNIPGFWPGDLSEFAFLSYHNRGYLLQRPPRSEDEFDTLTVQAILASYSWLLSLSCYQGFSTFHDLTYPLTTQTVITNGQWWSFCVYQLNTTLLHSEHADENPRRNICWITEPMKLFETVEGEKVYGLNKDVLRTLLKFYVNAPEKRVNVNMQPYLGETVKRIADIPQDDRRAWLENQFKHLMSNRPRHWNPPEIPHWQKIYLIDHETRPRFKKTDPWQFGYDPWKRRLDDIKPPYIPRCLREKPNKRKYGRWAKTYFPDA